MDIIYENGIITKPESPPQVPFKSAGQAFFTSLKKHSNKTLQVDGVTGEAETYKSVLQRSVRIAIQMRIRGVTSKDTITICSLNHLNICVPFFASLFLGAKMANLDYRIPIPEATHLMQKIDPKIIFVGLEGVDFIETILRATDKTALIIVFGETADYVNYFDLLAAEPTEVSFAPVEADSSDVAFICFSSGTTGLPKGVCLSHRAYLGQIATTMDVESCCDRILECSSLYWSTSAIYWGLTVLNGFCKVVMPTFNAAQVWSAISIYEPTYMFMTPFNMDKLWLNRNLKTKATSVKKISICGGMVFDYQFVRYKNIFPSASIVPLYGLTEIGILLYFPTETKMDEDLVNKKVGSVGSVLKGISYKVVDVDSEHVLGPGRTGELRVKTDNRLSGYYQADSSDAFDDDGWAKTGDLVYYDKDFCFFYVGRLKELIKYQTWHVSPKLIENLVLSLDCVSNVCVIGVVDEADGEHPMAVVELGRQQTGLNVIKEIHKLVDENLGDKYKLRGGVQIVKNIPMTITGKNDIKRLRSMFSNPKNAVES